MTVDPVALSVVDGTPISGNASAGDSTAQVEELQRSNERLVQLLLGVLGVITFVAGAIVAINVIQGDRALERDLAYLERKAADRVDVGLEVLRADQRDLKTKFESSGQETTTRLNSVRDALTALDDREEMRHQTSIRSSYIELLLIHRLSSREPGFFDGSFAPLTKPYFTWWLFRTSVDTKDVSLIREAWSLVEDVFLRSRMPIPSYSNYGMMLDEEVRKVEAIDAELGAAYAKAIATARTKRGPAFAQWGDGPITAVDLDARMEDDDDLNEREHPDPE